jgi:hypothetical protein
VTEHTDRLVNKYDVFILINDIKCRVKDSLIHGLFAQSFEILIIDVHLHGITDRKPVITFCTPAVDFNAFDTYIFLCK